MIGVFDSGIGGLSIVKPLRVLLPNADIIYFGDTGRVPYGTKSAQIIVKYSHQDVKFLLSQGVGSIIAACGTVSSNAMEQLNASYPDIPIIGITSPAAAAAVKATRSGRIGVMATAATVNSGIFQRLIGQINASCKIYAKACPLLVPLIENGYIGRDNAVTRMVTQDYLDPFREAQVDTIILGCTHYPLIKGIVADLMPQVTLIDAGEAASTEFASLESAKMEHDGSGSLQIYVSDISQEFTSTAEIFLEHKLENPVLKVEVDNF